jgi:organic hydroperoxide reductase OsmC/OhrA
MSFKVTLRNIDGATTAIATAGPRAVVVDRPAEAGGGGHGLNGGELLHIAVAACISNDLFREAAARGIALRRVVVEADGGYAGDPAVSTGISYAVEVAGDAPEADLRSLVAHVDAIAEIPNSLRGGTEVRLGTVRAVGDGSLTPPG